jgi:hypothetical protein
MSRVASRMIYPFTQIVEDVMREMRESSTEAAVEAKYQRRVNHVYMYDLPNRYEWDWLRSRSTIAVSGLYDTGTVAMTNASASITGTGTVWTSGMDGWLIKFSGDDTVYTFTYVSGTTGTISPAYLGDTDTSDTYQLYQPVYALPSDFAKFPIKDPRVWYWSSGAMIPVKWCDDEAFMKRSTYIGNKDPWGWREFPTKTSLGLSQIELCSPVNDDMSLGIEYLRAQQSMYEVTATTHGTTPCTTTTIYTTTDIASTIAVGMYFSVDPSTFGGDREWVQITAVGTSTVTNGFTVATLRSAPAVSSACTVCTAPIMPVQHQHVLFYGACMLTGLEQNDPASSGYVSAYANVVQEIMAAKNHKRYGDQRLGLYARRVR